MVIKYVVDKATTIKEYLKEKNHSRGSFVDIKYNNGMYLVNNMQVSNHYKLNIGDELIVVINSYKKESNIRSTPGEFKILYEDSYFLIIDKAYDLACIPTHAHFENNLASYVKNYYLQIGIMSNIHFINRLDRLTTGIVLIAKNGYIQHAMNSVEIHKEYLLLSENNHDFDSKLVESRIERDKTSKIKRINVPGISNSRTLIEKIDIVDNFLLCKATLFTGKTHQIRLHMKLLNNPIIGDELYGNIIDQKMYLHSFHTSFIHPITNELVDIVSYPDWDINYNILSIKP